MRIMLYVTEREFGTLFRLLINCNAITSHLLGYQTSDI